MLACDMGVVGRLFCGSIEDRRLEELRGGGRLVDAALGLLYPFRPYFEPVCSSLCGGKSTEDGGELPGVPGKVLVKERSAETILEIDSRNFEFCRVL